MENKRINIYLDYNILGHLQKSLDKDFVVSKLSDEFKSDYIALEKIWHAFVNDYFQMTTCEDDCFMEFTNYDESIQNYNDVERYLTQYPHMIQKFKLFKQLSHRELMICPFGEYGYGRGPFGGGPAEHYNLLDQVRIMLNKQDPKNGQKDRDARHIMHCVLYGCDFFLTMDYKVQCNFEKRFHLIQKFMDARKYSLQIKTPNALIQMLKSADFMNETEKILFRPLLLLP
jgi:hypothetical protein